MHNDVGLGRGLEFIDQIWMGCLHWLSGYGVGIVF